MRKELLICFITIILLLVFFNIEVISVQTGECIPEGGSGAVTPWSKDCCEGLVAIPCDRPDEFGNCPIEHCIGAFFCTKCGDGTCGPGENKCNCPEDCNAKGGVEGRGLLVHAKVVVEKNKTQPRDVIVWRIEVKKSILNSGPSFAECFGEVSVENSRVFFNGKQINILPDDIQQISREFKISSIKKIELREKSRKPIYSVKALRKVRVLFILPVVQEIEINVDAQSGEITSVNKPWWDFLVL